MSNIAAAARLPSYNGFPIPVAQPTYERQPGQSDTDWKNLGDKTKKEIVTRRNRAERLQRFQSGLGKATLTGLLGGTAAILTDLYLHDFVPDATRDTIADWGIVALGASLATQIGTGVAKEVISSPDKPVEQSIERMMSFNKIGGKHLAAKLAKWGSKFVKWGALGVAGLAVAEGLVGQDISGGTLEMLVPGSDILPNIPNIEPSMAYPAAGLAVAGEVAHRLYSTQDKTYEAAADFVRLDQAADKKSPEAKMFKGAKEFLQEKKGLAKMAWSKLLTGDPVEALFWNFQKSKADVEGIKGVGSATLSEIVRSNVGKWENLITNIKKYQTWPLIGAGITGLISPALSGPLADAMEVVNPSVWAGLAMTGLAKYALFDKPQAEYMQGVSYAFNTKLNTGREKRTVGPVI